MATDRDTLSQDAALLHASRPTKLPHVMAVVAIAAFLPAAGGTALAPNSSAPQSRDGGVFIAPLTVPLGVTGAQARTADNRGRRRRRLVP